MVDFYIDYCQLMLEREDYLAIAMLLKQIETTESDAVEDVLEVIYVMDKKADIKIRRALEEHQARLHRKRK